MKITGIIEGILASRSALKRVQEILPDVELAVFTGDGLDTYNTCDLCRRRCYGEHEFIYVKARDPLLQATFTIPVCLDDAACREKIESRKFQEAVKT